jgi:hypothetical protein
VRFQTLTAASMKIPSSDMTPRSYVVDRRFRGAYCLHNRDLSTLLFSSFIDVIKH